MKEIRIADCKELLVHGRTLPGRDPLALFWGGSSLELKVQCSELWLEIAGPYAEHENWIAIEINGEVMARQMVPKERTKICIFRNKLNTKPTRVRIIKEVQAMSADREHRLEFYTILHDGELLMPDPYERRIEFIGDSINSGEGSIGAKEEEEWISLFFSHVRAYPYLAAKELKADYRVISQSGWGIFAGWDNNFASAVPKYYEGICSLLPKDFALAGVHDANDFAAWQPDVICVNLGTNDDGAFHYAPYTDPETKEVTKLHMDGESFENGEYKAGDSYAPEDLERVKAAAKAFLYLLRRNNPEAYIIWAYGMLGDALAGVLGEVIEKYREESGDTRVEYLPLPATTPETTGARFHPGAAAHRAAAEVIVRRIKELGL